MLFIVDIVIAIDVDIAVDIAIATISSIANGQMCPDVFVQLATEIDSPRWLQHG